MQDALRHHVLTARELSVEFGIMQNEVYDHLKHIEKSMHKKKEKFKMIPSECLSCGFVFAKRHRLQRPGKCPICKKQQITEPRFSIED